MKKNIASFLVGIALAIYAVTTNTATSVSASAAILACILIIYSVRNKIKRQVAKTNITPFS